MDALRIVHVMNQFYAGVGGEARADMPLEARDGALGAGLQVNRLLGDRGAVVRTIVMGDNWAHQDPATAVDRAIEAIGSARPDGVILGPAFGSGRYGITCGRIGAAVSERLGIGAVVTAMHPENPGVEMFRRALVIVPATQTAAGMAQALETMVKLAVKLALGEPLGPPDTDGYLPRGLKKNVFHTEDAAERAVSMLLARMTGRPFSTEIALPRFAPVPPPSPIAAIRDATIAIVTTGGVVPKGNPDRMESRRASKWARYSLANLRSARREEWESIHGGFDNHHLNDDPNRVLPLDVLREMEGEQFGRLFPDVFSTVGSMMPVETAEAFGRDIARALAAGQVDGAILAAT